jgi:putative ubiquitin-RnfH superfamily antitoxin RatB of RatAB toxin-antitoxin module
MIRVEVVRAWPRRHESRVLELPEGATVAMALAACGREAAAVAVFGERAKPDRPLMDGDRIEILRPLVADPKDSRRRRAARGTS